MRFPWEKYEEIPAVRKNTLQIFITNRCNLKCKGCFARFVMQEKEGCIDLEEYEKVIENFLKKDGKQINILGGEPLLHPNLREILKLNREKNIRTTVYTNGNFLNRYTKENFQDIKVRVSLYCKTGNVKSAYELPKTDIPIDVCFMVSKNTTLEELCDSAIYVEKNYNCKVFFISGIRELDNPKKEFFEDTEITMSVLKYKELVHKFLEKYDGGMEIHISKRGVFESTKTITGNKCKFANYFVGGKIIQCPYDVVNLKFQRDYNFNQRYCQQNNTCLMSKIILRRREK